MKHRLFLGLCVLMAAMLVGARFSTVGAQTSSVPAGALTSYNDADPTKPRVQQYKPEQNAFVCENGENRYTRALYGGYTDYRIETSDRPIFAVVKKGHCKNVRFEIDDVPLEATQYCKASYENGRRDYVLSDSRWKNFTAIRIHVVAMPDEEGAIWQFVAEKAQRELKVKVKLTDIKQPKLKRNGDMGVDAPDSFDPDPEQRGYLEGWASHTRSFAHVVMKGDEIFKMSDVKAFKCYNDIVAYNDKLASRLQFSTPDPYLNALAGALVMAADGDWDGQTWLHGCIGWRMPLAGWRAAYVGDVLGWNDRAESHFNAYAKSQVTSVEPTIAHPSQDEKMNMARAEKRWGTQMYSNGYICRNPERNDQMHHYDMNLNYIDELLWHFQYNADLDYMRQMWPVIKAHLAWEKRNFDPDGDHLYDAYCCIWASDALYYSGGAVTHSSAYNYRAHKLAARIAELLGEDPTPYRQEAEAILKAMNERLWLPAPQNGELQGTGHWAEYQDALGLKRVHESAALWSVYTPIDCGACTPEQAYQATKYVDRFIPHFKIDSPWHKTIATSNWMPYAWSINNVAAAEVMHTALAYFEAGRHEEGYLLMRSNIIDQMYYGKSPANFGQLSYYDAARGECYRDFGDCIGISSRTLLQGCFGIVPDALNGQCIIRPGYPSEWQWASVRTPYLEYSFQRYGNEDRYEITQRFAQPLKIVFRQNLPNGQYCDIEGTAERHQVIRVERTAPAEEEHLYEYVMEGRMTEGTRDPIINRPFKKVPIDAYFNASVNDIFKNRYVSPRPQTTTLQIPIQGVGEWCHPEYTPVINDSVFRSLAQGDQFKVAGVPFRTPQQGQNIVYTSLWDNYPDEVVIPLKGKGTSIYVLMAGTTNHMQSHIDNGELVITYFDGSTDVLALRNPDNWCPIEQDYYVDGQAFMVAEPRPYRVCFGTGTVSRDLGKELDIKGVYGREIPGGAAQMLRLKLNAKKRLRSLTVRTLSNDVVIGLMAVTLQK